ncbi:hypothetical protein JTE90_017486 [Oedothorax gibbosus]|uniref:RING-type E3 ubiquitin transferase n=1 Tax=Oedothorax gibbosus TaxID=931172 RepID=A0AAV6UCH6_9ARAC|nr:hypothetical protein JTE90_017486 [Oedothorax gibbosus]
MDEHVMETDYQSLGCSICLSSYMMSCNVHILSCHHRFHLSCITPWLSKSKTCPTCRSIITTAAARKIRRKFLREKILHYSVLLLSVMDL